jgi:hypothetical protein
MEKLWHPQAFVHAHLATSARAPRRFAQAQNPVPPKFFHCSAPLPSRATGSNEAAIGAASQTRRKLTMSNNIPDFIVYGVTQTEKGKRDILTRIGAAWRHQKGDGINLNIRALPLNFEGKIVLFPPKAPEAVEAHDGDESMPF